MRIVPTNEAEAVIDPLWDPALSELSQWTIDPGAAHGLVVRQNWCWVDFAWTRRPVRGPALRMRRACGISCAGYDRLVLSVMAPEQAVVHLVAETDRGVRRLAAPPAGRKKAELALDLAGATRLDAVTVEVNAAADGLAQGWFNWLGLQHSGRLAHKLAVQTAWDEGWEKHLKDETFAPSFAPSYGLVLNRAELDALRQRHDALVAAGKPSPFAQAAAVARATPPETLIQEYVNFWGDSRYNRERDHDKYILSHGLNAAVAGHLLRDRSLLRLAARYAMSIGVCGKWDDGFICFYPGGTFDHRCFVQSLCAYEVAGILDLAGECFTDLGREFLLRRLAEALVSTDDGADVIPICDAGNRHEVISQAIMAGLLPQSAWTRMLHKSVARGDGWPVEIGQGIVKGFVPMMADAAIAWSMTGQVPPATTQPPALVTLPAMGPLVSQRRLGGHWIKIPVQGNRAGAGHTHEDKGSFVLEFAGDTFALDPGTCDYSHPLAGTLHNCERHNMLVPVGFAERPAPQSPLPVDVKPAGTGDGTRFHAEIDVTPGWTNYYRRWRRTWDSPEPAALTITDEYELAAGESVEFYWQTRLPVKLEGARAVVTGRRGCVVLEAPAGCAWRLDELSLLDGIQYRLAARQNGRSGTLSVQVRLVPRRGLGQSLVRTPNGADDCAGPGAWKKRLPVGLAGSGNGCMVLVRPRRRHLARGERLFEN